MERFGYHGKILHLNLKTRQSWIEEPEEWLVIAIRARLRRKSCKRSSASQ